MRTPIKALAALGFFLLTTACGEANTNDFRPSDNVLRRGSEGADDEELRALRRAGLPASIEEAYAASSGVVVKIQNNLDWPAGAREVPTVVHLNARLCGTQEPDSRSKRNDKEPKMVHCHEFRGTVNQNDHEVFYLTAGEALAIVKDNDAGYRASLQYKLTTQTTAIWYSGGTIDIHQEIDRGKQVVDVEVREALPTGYRDRRESRYTPSWLQAR